MIDEQIQINKYDSKKAFDDLEQYLKFIHVCLEKEDKLEDLRFQNITSKKKESFKKKQRIELDFEKQEKALLKDLHQKSNEIISQHKNRLKKVEQIHQSMKSAIIDKHQTIQKNRDETLKQKMELTWKDYREKSEKSKKLAKDKISKIKNILEQSKPIFKKHDDYLTKNKICCEYSPKLQKTEKIEADILQSMKANLKSFEVNGESIIKSSWGTFLKQTSPFWFVAVSLIVFWAVFYKVSTLFLTNNSTIPWWLFLSGVSTAGGLSIVFMKLLRSIGQKKVYVQMNLLINQRVDWESELEMTIEKIQENADSQELSYIYSRDESLLEIESQQKKIIEEDDFIFLSNLKHLNEKFNRVSLKVKTQGQKKLNNHKLKSEQIIEKFKHDFAIEQEKLKNDLESDSINGQLSEAYEHLRKSWLATSNDFFQKADCFSRMLTQQFPDWNKINYNDSRSYFPVSLPCGYMHVSFDSLYKGHLESDLKLPQDEPLKIPVTLDYPLKGSLIIESDHPNEDENANIILNMLLKCLAFFPTGKIKLCCIDPISLGQSFSGLMKLAESTNILIGKRILTENSSITEALRETTIHIEKIVQKYLMNDYSSIFDYNQEASDTAESIRILVLTGFPHSYDELQIEKIMSIMKSGPRCGVYTFLSLNSKIGLPRNVKLSRLKLNAQHLKYKNNAWHLDGDLYQDFPVELSTLPNKDQFDELMENITQQYSNLDSVRVPISRILSHMEPFFQQSTIDGLEIPFGVKGAKDNLSLCLGKGTQQHVLIAGRTGSGKSTLFHTLILSMAHAYTPEEVRVYLVDFKKGVEFKVYAEYKFPYADAIAIESDREFGLSVLKRIDSILKERGEIFRKEQVTQVSEYRAKTKEKMPRILVMIDEFQEYFVEEDHISQEATLLLDRIVRQGRAFGVHLILGSQTLAGAYSLSRSTMGQIGVRVALQCNETDASYILSDDNTATQLLSRPGEAIYNDASGDVSGNQFTQVVWADENAKKEYLKELKMKFIDNKHLPHVFEGGIAQDFMEFPPWKRAINQPISKIEKSIWLGESYEIGPPCEIKFDRYGGQNLFIVGQNREVMQLIQLSSLLGCIAQSHQQSHVGWVLQDGLSKKLLCDWTELFQTKSPSHLSWYYRQNMKTMLQEIEQCIHKREQMDNPDHEPDLFAWIFGIQNLHDLHIKETYGFEENEQDLEINDIFLDLVKRGPLVGIHWILTCDTVSHLQQALNRKGQEEWQIRILLQMAQQDSIDLIDSPLAHNLSLQEAVLYKMFDGETSKFRPIELGPVERMSELLGKT